MKKFFLIIITMFSFITIHAQTAEDFTSIALEKFFNKDYQGAIVAYNKAISLNPEDLSSYFYRGLCKDGILDHNGAILDFNKVIQSESDPYMMSLAFHARGFSKYSLQDIRGALLDFSEAIELKPEDSASYFYRGRCKGILDDDRGAVMDYTKAIELSPKYAEAYFYRAISKFSIGYSLKDSGCLDLSKAGELGYSRAYEFIQQYCK